MHSELVTAVNSAGGIGFLAAGYRSAVQVAEQIAQVRAMSTGPVGMNPFVLTEEPVDLAAVAAYRATLAVDAERLGVELGQPHWDDDGLTDNLHVVSDLRPEMVSFTFGTPGPDVLADPNVLTEGLSAPTRELEEPDDPTPCWLRSLLPRSRWFRGGGRLDEVDRRPTADQLAGADGELPIRVDTVQEALTRTPGAKQRGPEQSPPGWGV